MWPLPMILNTRPTTPPPTRYWHQVVITGDMFQLVHLRTYPPPPSHWYWHLVVTTESGRYASYWNAVLWPVLFLCHFFRSIHTKNKRILCGNRFCTLQVLFDMNSQKWKMFLIVVTQVIAILLEESLAEESRNDEGKKEIKHLHQWSIYRTRAGAVFAR